MSNPSITTAEYSARRARALTQLRGAAAVVFAGEGAPPLLGKWRPDYNFLYLTGLSSEAGAAVLFDPKAEDPKRRIVLFLRPLDPEMERWDGFRDPIAAALKEKTGFQTILRANHLPRVLANAARRARRVACLHPFATHTAPVSPDLAVFRKVAERIPGVVIEDRTNLLPSLRAIKSRAELALMQKAIEATVAGYSNACSVIRPGATEAQVQDALEHTYRNHGASGPAYNSIVGSGISGTVLHYMDNTGALQEGDLLVIDSGAEYGNYTADVTRTYPVSGKFTKDRAMYEVVLRDQQAAIKAARPGAMIWEVDRAARDVIDRAGYRDAYIHGIGHQLGLEVHDVTPDGPLVSGMIITIEPGIYLPELKSGIRIEDDILITKSGNRNLTEAIPKAAAEVERALRGPRRRPVQ